MINTLSYEIDASDAIVRIDGLWDRFASDNGAPHLSADSVLGRELWDHIAGAEMDHVYRLLVERVRQHGQPLEFTFRCDSPKCARHMRMIMASAKDKHVRFHSITEREEPRAPISLLEASEERSHEIIVMCSVCKCISNEQKEWLELDKAIRVLELFQTAPLPRISHGLCPACYDVLIKAQ